MSKAATTTELATQKNGNANLNGSATDDHDDVASVDLEGENEEEESDDYDEDEEADYEVCRTVPLIFLIADRCPSGGETDCRGRGRR